MKVLCIDNGPMENSVGRVLPAPQLTEGVDYTVIGLTSKGAYKLLECEPLFGCDGFNPKRFIPTSDIDETELIKQRESVLASV